ncbi:MAG TPA: DUF2087 domain-containing protein [Egibacteraceae bacterium]|jgi:hypothetical protein|nr:DUF2087 domain-containing protein [Egibacteraceae bacterium]
MVGALDFLKVVLEPRRLAVLGSVALQARTVGEIAGRTGQRPREVLETLAPLVQGGVVTRAGDRYAVSAEALRALARDLPQAAPPAREIGYGMTAEEQAVLARFFSGARLTEIPAARGKRRVVLERIALEFEPGRRYAERDVNALLERYHGDYAALRRYLVDEGFLDRARDEYWRAGGRVD